MGLDRPVLDKHSTGGVGDKVSLLLAPIVAACGGAVPMISGRGLGHTGGTLDKLDAIPGYDTTPDRERFAATVREAGCAIIGQTGDLAPADRRLYAIRDATGTVESIPLIVASILSKKLAAGLDALVMDVKVGSGAFLPELDQARELAQTIIEVAAGNGLPCAALLTDMDRVLGRSAGNAVEVRESIDHLTGRGERSAAARGHLRAVRAAAAPEGARRRPARRARVGRRGRGLRAHGRGARRPEGPARAPRGPPPRRAGDDRGAAQRPGVVAGIDVRAVGLAIIDLGGGRRREDDAIDHAVGLTKVAAPGERSAPGPAAGHRPRPRRGLRRARRRGARRRLPRRRPRDGREPRRPGDRGLGGRLRRQRERHGRAREQLGEHVAGPSGIVVDSSADAVAADPSSAHWLSRK